MYDVNLHKNFDVYSTFAVEVIEFNAVPWSSNTMLYSIDPGIKTALLTNKFPSGLGNGGL